MHNLEDKIAEWRKRMVVGGVKDAPVLDELESHLREEIRLQLSAGASEDRAFQVAAARIGEPDQMRKEFEKIKRPGSVLVVLGASLWAALAAYLVIVHVWGILTGRLNLLMSAHILAVTMGYTATLLVGGFGIFYICWRQLGKLSPERSEPLRRGVSNFITLAAVVIPLGFVLGMPWVKDHFGSNWVSGPRQIAAVCVIVWFTGLWVLQRFTRVSDSILMLLCIVGSMIVSIAWFDPGLRSMAAMLRGQENHWCLAMFLGLQFLVLLIGLPSFFSTNRFSWKSANS